MPVRAIPVIVLEALSTVLALAPVSSESDSEGTDRPYCNFFWPLQGSESPTRDIFIRTPHTQGSDLGYKTSEMQVMEPFGTSDRLL